MRHAYVYYRIDLTQVSLAGDRIDALLLAMAAYCDQPPHRMQRCDDPATWMETYPDITDFEAFTAVLNDATNTLACTEFVVGERHLECFSAPIISP